MVAQEAYFAKSPEIKIKRKPVQSMGLHDDIMMKAAVMTGFKDGHKVKGASVTEQNLS